MIKHHANFIVTKDEDGILCAADMEQGIFADGKTERELMVDIKEAVECHFDVVPEEVDSKVEIRITGLN
jgi:predicted RNase H-like HicB family nuclease